MIKKALHTVIWFVFFVLLAQVAVPLKRPDYYNMENDKALWVKEKIFGNHEDYDTIFLGTSHTLSAIDPRIIRPEAAKKGKALNLAICWGGRDLYYIFARDLLDNHRVKNLVVEVCSLKPHHVFHPAFRFYCSTRDVFTGPPLSVQVFALFHEKMLTTRLADICAALLKPPVIYLKAKFRALRPYNITYDSSLLGFGPQDLPPDKAKRLEEAFRMDPARVVRSNYKRHFYDPSYSDWFYYLRRISRLARLHHTHLYILYLPGRNYPIPPKELTDELSRLGTLVIPDLKKIYRYDLWHDDGHLNSKGALVLSEDLKGKIGY